MVARQDNGGSTQSGRPLNHIKPGPIVLNHVHVGRRKLPDISAKIPGHRQGFKEYFRHDDGRTGIYELLPIDAELCSMIIRRTSAKEIKEYALSKGMRTLRDDGLRKAFAGVTTLEEVLRVTQDDYADISL